MDDRIILMGTVGSIAYGLNTPESDKDYMGIYVAPLSYYFGVDSAKTINKKLPELNVEYTIYEWKQYLSGAINFNPNMIPLLFLNTELYTIISPAEELLLSERNLFKTKRAISSLLGYGFSQLESAIKNNTEKYGENRKRLVERFGYDIKQAAHTIRILRMAKELFETDELNVYREHDREELLSIRNGKYTKDEWLEIARSLLEETKRASEKCDFPEAPDYNKINNLSSFIIRTVHRL